MTTPVIDPNNDPHLVRVQDQGAQARREGLGKEACPFEEGNIPWTEWMEGFESSDGETGLPSK